MNKSSLDKLATCSPELIKLAHAIDELYPIQVVYGYRNEADQLKAFQLGNSKLLYPNSKHNHTPSLAMDIVPDPDRNPATVDWNDIGEFEKMLKIVQEKADELGIKIRLGKDFKFRDYPHVELV